MRSGAPPTVLQPIAQARGVAFIMNDRPDLAAELDCDGVHVGEEDMPYAEARRLLGPDRIVGVTCGDSRAPRHHRRRGRRRLRRLWRLLPERAPRRRQAPRRPRGAARLERNDGRAVLRDRRHHARRIAGPWSKPAPISSPVIGAIWSTRRARAQPCAISTRCSPATAAPTPADRQRGTRSSFCRLRKFGGTGWPGLV